MTLSGGECLLQGEFALELLKILKEKGINTAVDTCGCVPRSTFERVLPYVDAFLYDIKAIDPTVHEKCTGRDNSLILSNFDYLCSQNCDIEVRIPFVVGLNDGEIEKIGEFLRGKPVKKVTVLKYHDLARSKFAAVAFEKATQNFQKTPPWSPRQTSICRMSKIRLWIAKVLIR